MIKYATVGTSWITDAFISGARTVEGLSLSAVCSRNRERGEAFAQRNGAQKCYTDIYALAADNDIDAVYVASPNALHFSQSKLLLESGKHVICEKPATVTPQELQELLSLAAKHKLIYMEAIMYMHNPSRRILRRALNSIGTVRSAHFDFSQLSSKYPALVRGETPNVFNPKMAGGVLTDLGIYCIYPAVDLFGMPTTVNASASFLNTGADCCGAAELLYSDKLVTLTYSKVGQSRLGSQIFGDEGTITIGSISQLSYINVYNNAASVTPLVGEASHTELMANEARSLVRYISSPSQCAEECYRLGATALEVSRIMYDIRRKAGIVFSVDKFKA